MARPWLSTGLKYAFALVLGMAIGSAWINTGLVDSVRGDAHWQLTHVVKDTAPKIDAKAKGCDG